MGCLEPQGLVWEAQESLPRGAEWAFHQSSCVLYLVTSMYDAQDTPRESQVCADRHMYKLIKM